MSAHTLRVEFPLAGADDGLPVEIQFTYRPGSPDTYDKTRGGTGGWDPGYAAEVEFSSVTPVYPGALPAVLRAAIESWAEGWLTDEGYGRACDKALDDRQAEREQAAEYRREA